MAGQEWDWFQREELIGHISDIRVQNLQEDLTKEMFFGFGRMLKSQSLTWKIHEFLQIVPKMHLHLCWISISSVNIIILFQYAKGHMDGCSCADKFLVQFNSDHCNPSSQMVLDLKDLIQRYGFSFYLHIFTLDSVGKIQSCQFLPVGNALSDTTVTVWWNRLLDGFKTDGTTFGWTLGDQRTDIQLAPSSEQSTRGLVLESKLLDILVSRLVKT
ncbi:hypothetical protein WISP_102017 [Willisornis vidua]|uniref:Uncharacterized protein n=1 Tax=Willisornis vidua TaxID=1566151 RepID=A0ABQ9CYF7_9PASS|nr:hypothetical protein WISP_102017 [Willisornis vidua]